jgi:hypothetical protein
MIKFLQLGRYHGTGRTPGSLSLLVFLQDGCPGCHNQAMTIHAQTGSRKARMAAFFRSWMAIKTRDLQFPGVIPMRKSNGLNRLMILLVPGPIRSLQPQDKEYRTED